MINACPRHDVIIIALKGPGTYAVCGRQVKGLQTTDSAALQSRPQYVLLV